MATSTHTCTRSLKTQYVIGCHASEHSIRKLYTASAYAAGQFDALAHGHCGRGAEVEQLEGPAMLAGVPAKLAPESGCPGSCLHLALAIGLH